jgi:hypothetical protein
MQSQDNEMNFLSGIQVGSLVLTPPLLLSPKAGFLKGHKYSTCIQAPSPAAADVALEQLACSIHKRPYHTHLILISHLMMVQLRKLLGKTCCLIFTITVDSDI